MPDEDIINHQAEQEHHLMSIEAETPKPRTRASLAQDLRALRLEPGMIVILHSSLRSLGWVCGGPVAVVQALLDVLTPAGTLVVPTQTAVNSDPAQWSRPPVPESWWPIIRANMPAYDPRLTPSEHMGAIAEQVRTWPGSVRSDHPAVSFAAVGQDAAWLMADHALDFGLGEESPLRRIADRAGHILLLGADHDSNTSLHLAQYRVPACATPLPWGAARFEDGQRVWRDYQDIDLGTEDFPEIGAAFEQAHPCKIGSVGSATARLLPQGEMVDFAETWLRRKYMGEYVG
jgi:aminoglycoside 3-N-acetyltransferase